MLNNKCRTSFAKPEFLKKAQRANPRLYDIGCYNDNLALMLAPDTDEVIRLEKESRSKLSDLIRPFDYDKPNNLCLNEEIVADLRYFNSLESEEIDRLSREYYYADHMNAILGVYTELDEVTNLQCDYLELLEKCEGLETELSKSKMMSKSFESVQKHAINLKLVFQQRVIPTTSVSRPQLKSNPQGDRVMHNSSQGKKQEVEDHRRSVKLSKNKTSNKKPRNFTRKQYERVSKTCSWRHPKFTPSGYKCKPKSEKENINPNVSMPLGNASRTANVIDTMTYRCSTVSNTPLSSNSFAASRDCPIHRRLWMLKAHDGKSQAFNQLCGDVSGNGQI
nr:hypothetical protein [Tanacetum cinerariifolium]